MGRRGPAPKPTALRLLEGNPSGRPVNQNEPKPQQVTSFEPPQDLPEEGKAVWKALSQELARIGLLTVVDLEAFYRYVKYLLEYREADKKIAGMLVMPIRNPNGSIKYLMQNPYLSIRNQAADRLARLEQQFGMTPSARARMIGLVSGTYNPKDDEDPYGA